MKKVPFEYVDCSQCADLERQLEEAEEHLKIARWVLEMDDNGALAAERLGQGRDEIARLQARVEEVERKLHHREMGALDGDCPYQRERDEARALAERRKKALKPFSEVYGRTSKLVRGSRGMSSVPLRHRVVLLSEQSDGSFGYLAIKVFRDARAAIEEEKKA